MFWYWFFGILAVCLFAATVIVIRGRVLKQVSYCVTIPNLPKSFDGYRISLISDLHDRRFGSDNRILADAVLKSRPDVVILAGDLHEPPHSPEPFYNLLSQMSARVPVFYTEGNHDLRKRDSSQYNAHLEQISASGAALLNDTVVPLQKGGDCVLLYGQSWRGIKAKQTPVFDPDFPSILVCHDPMQFDRLDPLPDLMLSGHVHGGILRLPGIGPIFAPGDGTPVYKRFARRFFFPKYSKGLYHKGSHTLAVTQGLGFSILPIRFIPPEIMVLTLKSDKKTNNS